MSIVNRSIIPVRIATCLSYPVKVEDERFLWIHVDWSHVPGAYDNDKNDDDDDCSHVLGAYDDDDWSRVLGAYDDDKKNEEDDDWSHVLRTQHRGVG